MGTIDSREWKLKCPQCMATGIAWATQRGSSFNIGPWSDIRKSELFDITTSSVVIDGPELDTATCKKCQIPALINPDDA